jgi:predicted Fe-Mo cluster-binding NifX family protein
MIAIASLGNTLNSEVSEQAGRAPYFLLIEKGEIKEIIKNPFAFGGGGAGISVAKMLADKGISKIIVGKIGANAKEIFEKRNIEIEIKKGKIKDIL